MMLWFLLSLKWLNDNAWLVPLGSVFGGRPEVFGCDSQRRFLTSHEFRRHQNGHQNCAKVCWRWRTSCGSLTTAGGAPAEFEQRQMFFKD
jgi:hypothetical protein